jgi:hypothetical protein
MGSEFRNQMSCSQMLRSEMSCGQMLRIETSYSQMLRINVMGSELLGTKCHGVRTSKKIGSCMVTHTHLGGNTMRGKKIS